MFQQQTKIQIQLQTFNFRPIVYNAIRWLIKPLWSAVVEASSANHALQTKQVKVAQNVESPISPLKMKFSWENFWDK